MFGSWVSTLLFRSAIQTVIWFSSSRGFATVFFYGYYDYRLLLGTLLGPSSCFVNKLLVFKAVNIEVTTTVYTRFQQQRKIKEIGVTAYLVL